MPLQVQYSEEGSTSGPGQYSAFTVFPASLDSLRKAVKPSALNKVFRHSSVEETWATLDSARQQYESLMVLHLAQFCELVHKMSEAPSREQFSEWKAAADKRQEMMLRESTVIDWDKTRSASCVFTLQDLRLLKDTLTATNEFLVQCEVDGPTKTFWEQAVKFHGDECESRGFPRLASEDLRCGARKAVDQLLQWSDKLHAANASVTTSADFKDHNDKKQVEFNKLSELISWPEDRSERSSKALFRNLHFRLPGSLSPDKVIRRVRSNLRLEGNPSTSGPQNGEETTFTQSRTADGPDVPQINVTNVEEV